MENIIYCTTVLVYVLFLLRFILSWVGGDLDLDSDLDVSDVVSFKGLNHFLMGTTGWLSIKIYVTQSLEWYDYLISFIVGIIFVVILYYVYKFMMKLESFPNYLSGEDLIGKLGTVYLYTKYNKGNYYYVVALPDREVNGISPRRLNVGDKVVLSSYNKPYYTLI